MHRYQDIKCSEGCISKENQVRSKSVLENKELKNCPDKYKDISVTHDYNRFERRLMKQWVCKAKEESRRNPQDGII